MMTKGRLSNLSNKIFEKDNTAATFALSIIKNTFRNCAEGIKWFKVSPYYL